MSATTYPRFTVDRSKRPRDVGGPYRYVVVFGGHPIVWHRSNGVATYMVYRTLVGANQGRTRARNTLHAAQVGVYDKRDGALV